MVFETGVWTAENKKKYLLKDMAKDIQQPMKNAH
jgi:hypothetical protein